MMPLTLQPFPSQIFRAYDIRGALLYFTEDVMWSIAQSFAFQLNHQKIDHIVLGHDARLMGMRYAQIMIQVLNQHHIEVTFLGCCSTPVMYFMAKQTRYQTGIILTASHNEKTDFGVKWILHNKPSAPADIQIIAQHAQSYYDGIETQYKINQDFILPKAISTSSYLDFLKQDMKLDRVLTIVIDGMHGSAGTYAQRIFEDLGYHVLALRCDPNGHFPDHAPDPSKEIHLTELKKLVLQHNADLGIALDGDGDRLVVVDEHAQILSPDQLICVFTKMCLMNYPKHQIVFDVKCSGMVEQTIHDLGGQPVMLRTGSTFLRQYLLDSHHQAVFGGEYAGHYVFNDGRGQGYDDGLYAALRLIEYFLESKLSSISLLFNDYPQRYFTEDTYIDLNGELVCDLFSFFKKNSQQVDAKITEIDGIRLDFPEGTGIIRASNTGSYLTVRFDATTQIHLKNIQQYFADILQTRYPHIALSILQAH